jgi:Holin of 3TMs, for gene-transfer release
MTEKAYDKMSDSEKRKEDWMNSKWRPMMGWMYMLVCTMDFVVFPILWSLLHAGLQTGQTAQWNPLTLQGAGLFHMAMGAIIGVAAFGRTQEKLAGANVGGMAPVGQTVTTTFGNPAPSFGSSPHAPAFGSSPAPAFGSKPKGPGPQSFPEL